MNGSTLIAPALARLFAPLVLLVVPAVAAAQSRELRLEEFRVEGKVQRPQASFFLPRSGKVDLGVDVRALKPRMTAHWGDLPERRPDFFDTDRR